MVTTSGHGLALGRARATKFIETDCFVEIYQYEDMPQSYRDDALFEDPLANMTPDYGDGSGDAEDGEDGAQLALELDGDRRAVAAAYDAAKRRLTHYEAQRHEIRRVIECNQTEDPQRTKFYTLTFAENDEKTNDVAWCNRQLGNHFKRLKRYLAKAEPGVELRYLACIERQKRGAVHYHVCLFDFPYVPKAELERLWGWGFIDIKALESLDAYENVGLYISKYFTKDIDHDKGKKKWWTSRNLKRPTVIATVTRGVDLAGADVAWEYEYERWVRDPDTGDYRASKVKYAKVRNKGRGIGAFWTPDALA